VATYWPTQLGADQLRQAGSTDAVYEQLTGEALAYYERREAELGPDTMREVERQVMLRIIDQRWREHLYEMDYLQEGINLRAMGQKDPLVEWQREGYQMFGEMMHAVSQDFVKYVMHVEVTVQQQQAAEPDVKNVQYSAPEGPVQGSAGLRQAAAAEAAEMGGGPMGDGALGPGAPAMPQQPDPEQSMTPVVKSAEEKVGRNEPCWCGSGKKFKHCHGRA
jgi:preprotein translocase subunit SecA